MSYATDLPPVLRRTNQTPGGSADDWRLETASGGTIATYQTVGIEPAVWWPDLLTFVASNAPSTSAAIQDVTLLLIERSWTVEK